jgi:ABC-type glycerol-3-phosphate transport system substrate-binding protein
MKKINLILSLSAVALFAACSGSTDSAAADTTATQDTAAASPAAATPEATVAPAPEAEGTTIKVDPNGAEIKTEKGSVEASKDGIEIKKP